MRKLIKVEGFTLVEVMVSLAIFALISVALLKASGQTSSQIYHNQQLTFSRYVAELYAAEHQLGLDRENSFLSSYSMGKQNWTVRTTEARASTEEVLLTQLEVESDQGLRFFQEVYIP